MAQAARRRLAERELHEYVAEVEGHDSQVTGVVGYFYAMYRAEVLARVQGLPGRDILEVGCGEGMMFDGSGIQPVQMDVSVTRVSRAAGKANRFNYPAASTLIVKAPAGHIKAQSVQLTQWPGRGNQGIAPAISRQSVGQVKTQSPQPVQRVSSKTGMACSTSAPPVLWRRS